MLRNCWRRLPIGGLTLPVLLEYSSGHLLAELRSTSSAHINAVVLKGQPGGTVI